MLSSSLPLEYEVRKILTKNDVTVTFEYPYFRQEGAERRAFFVDIDSHYTHLGAGENVIGETAFLIECKYREEGKKWLFLPEQEIEPEIS